MIQPVFTPLDKERQKMTELDSRAGRRIPPPSVSAIGMCRRDTLSRKTTITSYFFRHQVAADMKADGRPDSGEISAALGHRSDATKSTYGHANMCKGRGAMPAKVTAPRPVDMRAAVQVKNMGKVQK